MVPSIGRARLAAEPPRGRNGGAKGYALAVIVSGVAPVPVASAGARCTELPRLAARAQFTWTRLCASDVP